MPTMTNADFIRSRPDNMKPAELIAEAKKIANLDIAPAQVYQVRSQDKKNREREEAEKKKAETPRAVRGAASDQMLDYLKDHLGDKEMTSESIAKDLNVHPKAARATLVRLKDAGRIDYPHRRLDLVKILPPGSVARVNHAPRPGSADERLDGLAQFLEQFVAKEKRAPVLMEIARQTGHARSYVSHAMARLKARGQISFGDHGYQDLKVLRGASKSNGHTPLLPAAPAGDIGAAKETLKRAIEQKIEALQAQLRAIDEL